MANSPPPPHSYPPIQQPGGISRPRPANISVPGEPPAKRPRLSPQPGSQYGMPFASSPVSTSPLVPYSALPDHSPLQTFNTPQPVQPYQPNVSSRNLAGAMPPPERRPDRPQEKPLRKDKDMDVSDLQDVINASGIDLREEENFMASTYRYPGESSTQSTSFGSYTPSPNDSFGQWRQGSFGSQSAFQGAGPYSQPAIPQKTVEQLVEEKHRAAARRLAEQQEKHIRNPFLNGEHLRNKLQDVTYKNNIRFTIDGRPAPSDRPKVFRTFKEGADGIGIIQARSQSAITESSKLADMLSLISLAAEERLRGILEDAVSMARSRRGTSEGIVPADFVDIADGPSKPTKTTLTIPPKPITSSAWEGIVAPDSAVSPFTVVPPALPNDGSVPSTTITEPNSQDTVMSDAPSSSLPNGEPTSAPAVQPHLPPTPPTSEPKETISFSSPFPPLLRTLGTEDLAAEKARLEARKRRKAEREAKEKERTGSASGAAGENPSPSSADPTSAATPGTPATDLKSEIAPTKLNKKEREKLAKQNQTTEAAARQASNATAAMALGGSKKYSWMTGASSTHSTPTFGAGAGMGPARNPSLATKAAAAVAAKETEEEKALKAKGDYKKWGTFKESGKDGEGVQVRDVLAVLERDAGFGDLGAERVLARGWLVKVREEEGEDMGRPRGSVGYGSASAPTTPGINGAR